MADRDAWLDEWPPEFIYACGAWPRRQERQARAARMQLLDALADHGVYEDDYRLISWARALVATVNDRLEARGSPMVYSLGMYVTTPGRELAAAARQAEVR